MAEPVKTQFFAPTPSQPDFSGLAQLPGMTQAAWAAAGQAIGEGLVGMAKGLKEQRQKDEVKKLMDSLSSEDLWDPLEIMPMEKAFPGVLEKHTAETGEVDKAAVIYEVSQKLMRDQRIAQPEAERMAAELMEPKTFYAMRPEKRGAWMKTFGRLVAEGVPAEQLQQTANLLTKDRFFTDTERQQGIKGYVDQLLAPSKLGEREEISLKKQAQMDLMEWEGLLTRAQEDHRRFQDEKSRAFLMEMEWGYRHAQDQYLQASAIEQRMQEQRYKTEEAKRTSDRSLEADLKVLEKKIEGDLRIVEREAELAGVGTIKLTEANRTALETAHQAIVQFNQNGKLLRYGVTMDPKDWPIIQDVETVKSMATRAGTTITEADLRSVHLSFDSNGRLRVTRADATQILPSTDKKTQFLQALVDADPTARDTVAMQLLMAGREVTGEQLARMAKILRETNPTQMDSLILLVARSSNETANTSMPGARFVAPDYTQRVR